MTLVNGTIDDRPVTEVEYKFPFGYIRGKWYGSKDQQPVLALHGWQDNAGTFDNLIPLLPADLSYLCLDLPGHGLSDHYPQGLMYYIFVDTLVLIRRFVLKFKWEKITILGHSLGGCAGFLYAAYFPDDIERLICIDVATPYVVNITKATDLFRSHIDKFFSYDSYDVPKYHSLEQNIQIMMDGHKGSLTKESCKVLMRRGLKQNPFNQNEYTFSRDPRLKVAGFDFSTVDEVEHLASLIKCKYLNIRAKQGAVHQDYPMMYNDVINIIKRSAEKCDYYELPGTHHLHLNNPKVISGIISDFLKS